MGRRRWRPCLHPWEPRHPVTRDGLPAAGCVLSGFYRRLCAGVYLSLGCWLSCLGGVDHRGGGGFVGVLVPACGLLGVGPGSGWWEVRWTCRAGWAAACWTASLATARHQQSLPCRPGASAASSRSHTRPAVHSAKRRTPWRGRPRTMPGSSATRSRSRSRTRGRRAPAGRHAVLPHLPGGGSSPRAAAGGWPPTTRRARAEPPALRVGRYPDNGLAGSPPAKPPPAWSLWHSLPPVGARRLGPASMLVGFRWISVVCSLSVMGPGWRAGRLRTVEVGTESGCTFLPCRGEPVTIGAVPIRGSAR